MKTNAKKAIRETVRPKYIVEEITETTKVYAGAMTVCTECNSLMVEKMYGGISEWVCKGCGSTMTETQTRPL